MSLAKLFKRVGKSCEGITVFYGPSVPAASSFTEAFSDGVIVDAATEQISEPGQVMLVLNGDKLSTGDPALDMLREAAASGAKVFIQHCDRGVIKENAYGDNPWIVFNRKLYGQPRGFQDFIELRKFEAQERDFWDQVGEKLNSILIENDVYDRSGDLEILRPEWDKERRLPLATPDQLKTRVEHVIRRKGRLLIIGNPGVGKSTIVTDTLKHAYPREGSVIAVNAAHLDMIDIVGIPDIIEVKPKKADADKSGEDKSAKNEAMIRVHGPGKSLQSNFLRALREKEKTADATTKKILTLIRPEYWDKAEAIFVDEISRSAGAVSNALMTIILDGEICGEKLANLKVVIAAMNPPGEENTSPMDLASFQRFDDKVILVPYPTAESIQDWCRRGDPRIEVSKKEAQAMVDWWFSDDMTPSMRRVISPRTLVKALRAWTYLPGEEPLTDDKRLSLLHGALGSFEDHLPGETLPIAKLGNMLLGKTFDLDVELRQAKADDSYLADKLADHEYKAKLIMAVQTFVADNFKRDHMDPTVARDRLYKLASYAPILEALLNSKVSHDERRRMLSGRDGLIKAWLIWEDEFKKQTNEDVKALCYILSEIIKEIEKESQAASTDMLKRLREEADKIKSQL